MIIFFAGLWMCEVIGIFSGKKVHCAQVALHL